MGWLDSCGRRGAEEIGARVVSERALALCAPEHLNANAPSCRSRTPGLRLLVVTRCPRCGKESPPKFRLCGYCGTTLAGLAAPPALPPREVRRTVTIVFCDLKDSTALGERLDPEALHEVKDRYFTAMAAQITRHGGKIEKYIGDAIMAVFGLPVQHEDDALRAVRAAAGMQAALRTVNEDLRGALRRRAREAHRRQHRRGRRERRPHGGPEARHRRRRQRHGTARAGGAGRTRSTSARRTYRLVRDAVEVEAGRAARAEGQERARRRRSGSSRRADAKATCAATTRRSSAATRS